MTNERIAHYADRLGRIENASAETVAEWIEIHQFEADHWFGDDKGGYISLETENLFEQFQNEGGDAKTEWPAR